MDTMLDEMSAGQLVEWELMFDYWNVGDYPGFRADVIGATIAAVLANIHKSRGHRDYSVQDFIPVFQEASSDPDADLWQAMLASSVPKRTGAPPRKPRREKLKAHNKPE